MSINLDNGYNELRPYIGKTLQVVCYREEGQEPANVSMECEETGEVILSFDKPKIPVPKNDKAIDEAMNVIEANMFIGDACFKLIRQQLELVAKAARREALNDAADGWGRSIEDGAYFVRNTRVERVLRHMAEEGAK